ncbi:MAG: hypothetical protein ACRC28_18855 [Clostridium sp.]|uniref:hypothetical protein n=1 Tax=Clostridium sp. TaxID=1506 RepID=UPI003F39E03F
MSKELILVVGKSASGKDYIVDKACDRYGMSKVISKTTRQPRYEGEDTHIFASEYIRDCEYYSAIAKTVFNGNYYWTTKKDLEGKDFYIIDPKGVESMDTENCIVIYLEIGLFTRIRQMFKRGDKIKNIISRLWNDRKEFKGFDKKADYVVRSDWEFDDIILQRVLMEKIDKLEAKYN